MPVNAARSAVGDRRAGPRQSQAAEDLRWLGIQGRHLVTLLTVAEAGTFAGAAARLGYTQSTISHQVATLERLVGDRLVERGPGAGLVRLTPAGEVMLEHAGAIMARLGAARADLAVTRREATAGLLRLGVFQSVATSILPRVVAGLARELPDVSLEILECGAGPGLQGLVARGELDLAFALGPPGHDSLEHVVIQRERFFLLLPGVDLSDQAFHGMRLAAPRPCPVQERVERTLCGRGLRARDILRIDDFAVIDALVAFGSMFGLVPGHASPQGGPPAVEVDPSLVRTVIACWHADRRLAAPARLAIELAREAAGGPLGTA